MAKPVEALGKVLSKVDRSDREMEAARLQSWAVWAEFETNYTWIGQLTQTLCQLAGEPELAKRTHKPLRELDRRLRPRRRKKQPQVKATILEAALTESVVADSQVQVAQSLPEAGDQEAVGDSDLQVVESVPKLVESVPKLPESDPQESGLQVACRGPGRRTVKRSLWRRFAPRSRLLDGVGGAGERRGRTGVGALDGRLPAQSAGAKRANTSLAERMRRFWVRE